MNLLFALVLAVRGGAALPVVVPTLPSPTVQYAAEEWRDYVRKATGAEVAILTNASCAALRIEQDRTMGDAFELTEKDGSLTVLGGEKGVLYGVYELLERFAGVCWVAAGQEVVPRCERIAVPSGFSFADKPAIEVRDTAWATVAYNPEFAARMRLNGAYSVAKGKVGEREGLFDWQLRRCHTMAWLVPDSLFETHPEYFALANGKRQKSYGQVCITNPGLRRHIREKVVRHIREVRAKNPRARYFGISYNDGYEGICQCAECLKDAEWHGSRMGSLLTLINEIADEIAPEGSVPLDAAPDKSAGAFRPPAVPLVSVDPYFSLWSAADRLYDADTTFWTGKPQPLSVILTADGVDYRLCGRTDGLELPTLEQKAVEVGATTTRYRFAGVKGLQAEVAFTTPRLTDDLEVFSRPVTYLAVRVSGAKAHQVKATLSGAFATNDDDAEMVWTTNTVAGLRDVSVGRREQTPFSQSGDRQRPNWGFAHLVGPIAESGETVFLLAYDSVESVRFFGMPCVDWWRRNGKAFEEMLREAVRDYPSLAEKCRRFDGGFSDDMRRIGGPDYADVANLAWRQSFGACKFVAGPGREPMFLSNENGSGGMIGTTDVFYPQLPHLLLSSLTLAKASLAPTCIYAASTNWPYAYAPHDLGRFPIAEGQYYGMKAGQSVGGGTDDTYRMPVEECGNMLLCLAAVTKAEGHAGFVSRWWDEVSGWAAYLEKFGFDPGNQLCTDDFAGHLAHNANLSVKSILALAAYGQMAGMRGERETAARYRTLAAGMVPQWLEAAKGGAYGGYRIAFDRPDTWSLKYNLVWDRLLGLNLFPPSVAEAELRAYRAAEQPYGVPLDCRKSYTKADWLIWCGALTGRREDLAFMAGGIRRFLNGSPDRIPFSDWYFADSGLYRGFIARSVVGGVFLPVLQHPDLVEKYRK